MFCRNIKKNSNAGTELCLLCLDFIRLISPLVDTNRLEQLLFWKTRATLLHFTFICCSSAKSELQVSDWKQVKSWSDNLIRELDELKVQSEEWLECYKQIHSFCFQAELVVGSTEQCTEIIERTSSLAPKVCASSLELFATLITHSKRSMSRKLKSELLLSVINVAFGIANPSCCATSSIAKRIRSFLDLSDDSQEPERERLVA
ncbi:uncharacterized protein LODBEIA_P03130 [Lodderomyces beijingensis]|uniref:Uncharacterized protein n=1 Tax=Lodderomyces beijingensis TaxID=1775926 RepID=A0ABP0ZD13_9ASCO